MSLIPGITSQKTELIDGVKVDFISELTAGSGAQLQGRTNGVAIEQWKVGEKVTWITPPVLFTGFTTETDWANAYITITAGRWLVIANISAGYETALVAGDRGYTSVKITDSSNTVVQNCSKRLYSRNPATVSPWASGFIPFSFVADITSTTVYKIRVAKVDISGTGFSSVDNTVSNATASEFFAIRIA